MHRNAGWNERPHVLRYQHDGVGTSGYELTKPLQDPAFVCYSPLAIFYAQQITSSKCHNQWQRFRPGQYSTLTKLGVHQVVPLLAQFAAQASPGFHIVNQALAAPKMEHVHVNACAPDEFDLPHNEGDSPWQVGRGPFTGNHQDAHGLLSASKVNTACSRPGLLCNLAPA